MQPRLGGSCSTAAAPGLLVPPCPRMHPLALCQTEAAALFRNQTSHSPFFHPASGPRSFPFLQPLPLLPVRPFCRGPLRPIGVVGSPPLLACSPVVRRWIPCPQPQSSSPSHPPHSIIPLVRACFLIWSTLDARVAPPPPRPLPPLRTPSRLMLPVVAAVEACPPLLSAQARVLPTLSLPRLLAALAALAHRPPPSRKPVVWRAASVGLRPTWRTALYCTPLKCTAPLGCPSVQFPSPLSYQILLLVIFVISRPFPLSEGSLEGVPSASPLSPSPPKQ